MPTEDHASDDDTSTRGHRRPRRPPRRGRPRRRRRPRRSRARRRSGPRPDRYVPPGSPARSAWRSVSSSSLGFVLATSRARRLTLRPSPRRGRDPARSRIRNLHCRGHPDRRLCRIPIDRHAGRSAGTLCPAGRDAQPRSLGVYFAMRFRPIVLTAAAAIVFAACSGGRGDDRSLDGPRRVRPDDGSVRRGAPRLPWSRRWLRP